MKKLWITGLVLLAALSALSSARSAPATVYNVENTADSGFGSLRWAITQANSHPGPDSIQFYIGKGCDPVCTIQPESALPTLTDDGTTIDGYTQSGAAPAAAGTPAVILIEIDGSLAGLVNGLEISSTNNIIRGLAINRFSGNGIAIGYATAKGNLIAGNYIGTDAAGTTDLGNDLSGVFIGLGAANNTVGGGVIAQRNILSGNGWEGVGIHGAGTNNNTVAGNYIGTDAAGTGDLGNTLYGVRIYGGAQNNTVGGVTPSTRNIISGNEQDGVRIVGAGTTGNRVASNFIGSKVGGAAGLGNGANGVYVLNGAQDNLIGPANLIAYNTAHGVAVDGSATAGNDITQNYIFSNDMGIRLTNGANGGILAPTISAVTVAPGSVTIAGTACANCTVEAFVNINNDGEGMALIGSATASSGGDFTLAAGHLPWPFVTATARDVMSGTSEFSAVFTAPLLAITSGPRVSAILQTSATITWTTNLGSNSVVEFGRFAGGYEDQASNAALTQNHVISLTGLHSATTYRYVVHSTDAASNTVASRAMYFRTLSPPDVVSPTVSMPTASGDPADFPTEFGAEASDDQQVDRVEFYLEDEFIGADYGAPFRAQFNPVGMSIAPDMISGTRLVSVSAFDVVGNLSSAELAIEMIHECANTDMRVLFEEPGHDVWVYTDDPVAPSVNLSLQVTATVMEYNTIWVGQDPRLVEEWVTAPMVRFSIHGTRFATDTTASSGVFSATYNTAGLAVGEHTLYATAVASNNCTAQDNIAIHVVGPPALEMSRAAVKQGNYLSVTLNITNTGTGPAHIHVVTDSLAGFQAVAGAFSPQDTRTIFSPADRRLLVGLAPQGLSHFLESGESLDLEYVAVPVLYAGLDDYEISGGTIAFSDEDGADFIQDMDIETTHVSVPGSGRITLETAVEQMLSASDYLLVTNPFNIVGLYGQEAGNNVLSKMAELATLRNGVLGYHYSYVPFETTFQAGDLLATGHIFGDGLDEISTADYCASLIRVYDVGGELTLDEGQLPFTPTLHAGDVLAMGNVSDEDADGAAHGRAEIVLAQGSGTGAGTVTVYQYNWDPGSTHFEDFSLSTDFREGDGFAVGDVTAAGWAQEEIVVATSGGTVEIYENLSSLPASSFSSGFSTDDLLAVGNIDPDEARDEIVMASLADDRVRVYAYTWDSATGYRWRQHVSFDRAIEAGDQLAVGDVWGDDAEEIILADESADRIRIYTYDATPGELDRVATLDVLLGPDDRVAVADFMPLGKGEVLVARGSSSGEHVAGVVEVYVLSDIQDPGGRNSLDALLDSGGEWASQLAPTWADEGYLLFVGEIEILPTFSGDWEAFGDHFPVDYMDRDYANTGGDANHPELSMGRLIGNSGERLVKVLQTSIDIARGLEDFDSSDAYAVSGSNTGPSGDSDDIDFTDERSTVASHLSASGYTVLQEHTPDEDDFFWHARDKDVIFMAGHGNWYLWDVIHRNEVRDDFDPHLSHPLVYAASCLTGRYPEGRTIAEEFLNGGAAAYIGATQEGIWPWGKRLGESFFSRLEPGRTVGRALRDAKNYRVDANTWAWDHEYNQYNCAIFHLYGDPKLEPDWTLARSSQAGREPERVQGPLSPLNVTVPDYTVTHFASGDRVQIPGGGEVLQPGNPAVPSFSVFVDYPKGYQVQDVVMVGKSGLMTATGLVITDVVAATPGTPAALLAQAGEGPDWWPDRDYAWSVIQNPDDSTSLVVTVYPFFYNQQTTQARFYRYYTFTVESTLSTVQIRSLSMQRAAYDPGETVTADLLATKMQGAPIDVVVEALLMQGGTQVAALPLHTLSAVKGPASYAIDWDTTGFAPGRYELEVALKSTGGDLLDRASSSFWVGLADAQIAIQAAPISFTIGSNVSISLTLENLGSVSLTGTATIRVQHVISGVLQEFSHEFADHGPGSTLVLTDTWASAGAPAGDYRVAGTASFAGQSTAPAIVAINGVRRSYIYLPLVLK